jgi:hypothetical protein
MARLSHCYCQVPCCVLLVARGLSTKAIARAVERAPALGPSPSVSAAPGIVPLRADIFDLKPERTEVTAQRPLLRGPGLLVHDLCEPCSARTRTLTTYLKHPDNV